MRLINILAVLFALSILQIETNAQDYNFNNVIPPAPTAASLGKFVDHPVNLYTGTPSVSVPIWTVNYKDISVPISLSYHASGVKVEDIPGWVGSNWSLSAGGSISRSVRGVPDDAAGGFYTGWGNGIDEAFANSVSGWLAEKTDNFLYQILNGQLDFEPDVFYFSFPGGSGKFCFDENRNIVMEKHSAIKIIQNANSNFQQWEIIDESGMKYIFGKDDVIGIDGNEKTQTETSGNSVSYYTSNWNLIRIISPAGDVVDFHYDGFAYTYDFKINESKRYYCEGGNPIEYNQNSSTTSLMGKRLSKIQTTGQTVDFYANTDRTDLPGTKSLDEIKISSTEDIRHFYFSYQRNDYRLFLTSILEKQGNEEKETKFEYDGINDLPSRLSKSQDHWGYYNGQANSSLVPTIYTSCGKIEGANRESNYDKMLSGSLKKKIFPTGGYIEYFYGNHDFGYIGNEEASELIITPKAPLIVENSCDQGYCPDNTLSETLSINCYQWIEIEYLCENNTLPEGDAGDVRIDIKKDGISILDNIFQGNDSGEMEIEVYPGTYTIEVTANVIGDHGKITVNYGEFTGYDKKLAAGGLRIEKTVLYDGISEENNIVTEYEYTMESDSERSSGVLVNMPNYFEIGNFNPNPAIPPSGKFRVSFLTPATDGPTTYNIHSNSMAVLGTSQGSPVAYREVTVTQTGNGTILNKFISPFDFPDDELSQWPYAPGTNYDWKRGVLDTQEKKLGTQTKAKVENFYSNQIMTRSPGIKFGYKHRNIDPNQVLIDDADIVATDYIFNSGWHNLIETRQTQVASNSSDEITNITKYRYDDASHAQLTRSIGVVSDTKEKVTQYVYPTDYANIPTSGFIGAMKYYNVHKPIEVVTYQCDIGGGNEEILSAEINSYMDGSALGKINGKWILESNAPIPLQNFKFSNMSSQGLLPDYQTPQLNFDTINFDDVYPPEENVEVLYYLGGNIKQVTKRNELPTTYIWGYNGRYPVAKVEGLSAADINTQTGTNCEDFNETNVDTLRDQLSSAFVTTYTYKPLVGIISSTDPNGKTTYYDYDDLGRLLKTWRDAEDDTDPAKKYLLQQYEYHYKGQPMPTY